MFYKKMEPNQSKLRRSEKFDFHGMFNPAILEAFSRQNLISAFSKPGIFPLNRMAIPDEALTTNTSLMSNATGNVDEPARTTSSVDETALLRLPDFTTSVQKVVRRRRDPAASVHLPRNGISIGEETSCDPSTSSSTSTSTSTSAKSRKINRKSEEDDWFYPTCNESYNKGHNKSPWIQFCFCLRWYHENCQSIDSKNSPAVFMGNICAQQEENSSESD